MGVKKGQKKSRKKLSDAAALVHTINAALKTDVRLGNDPYFEITRIPTGSLVMDRITGGGWALGRHYELYGDESAGKSYILYRTLALSQERGKICALVDPEHSFDYAWFKHLGGDPDTLLTQHPENAEDAIAVMMLLATLAEEREIEVVGMDSVSSLVPREETEKDPRDEPRVAGQARMMSRALRRITTVNRKTLFIWTNQLRTDIGVKFGNPSVTSGGKALRFYATGRIEMRKGTKVRAKRKVARGAKLVEAEVQTARWIQVRAEKDKSTRPYREGSFIFSTETDSIDIASEIIQLGLEDGLIEQTARGYSYVDIDDHEWKGTRKQFEKYLRTEEELQQELVVAIQDNTIQQELGDGEASDT
jgi:recombination protein RecA